MVEFVLCKSQNRILNKMIGNTDWKIHAEVKRRIIELLPGLLTRKTERERESKKKTTTKQFIVYKKSSSKDR